MLTLVPPLIVPIVNVVLGPSGTFTCATFAPARHMAWTALGHSEKFVQEWPPGPVIVKR